MGLPADPHGPCYCKDHQSDRDCSGGYLSDILPGGVGPLRWVGSPKNTLRDRLRRRRIAADAGSN